MTSVNGHRLVESGNGVQLMTHLRLNSKIMRAIKLYANKTINVHLCCSGTYVITFKKETYEVGS